MHTVRGGCAGAGALAVGFVAAVFVADVARFHFYYKSIIEIPPVVDENGAFNVQ